MSAINVVVVPVTGFQQNCSIVQCTQTKEVAVIDPGGDLEVILEALDEVGGELQAIWVTHAHIDHAGRLPLLVNRGYKGPIYTQHASKALCEIMLPDSGYLNEKDVEWENKRRRETGKPMLEPLYTRAEAEYSLGQITSIDYEQATEILPLGGLDPECVITPGIFVDRVVEVAEPLQESALVAEGVSYP